MVRTEDVDALLAAGRTDAAIAAVTLSADAGDVDALMRLATWRLIGTPLSRDLAAARALLRQAVEIGHVDAALMEIALTANGSGAAADWAGALALLRIAAGNDEIARRQLDLLTLMKLDIEGAPIEAPTAQRLSTVPNVWRIGGLLTRDECAHLAGVAGPLLAPANVVDPGTGRSVPHPVRRASDAVIGPAQEDLVVRAINKRIAAASDTQVDQGEPLTVLNYGIGQQYRPHLDALPAASNQRIRTVLIYLNQGFRGGETRFTANGLTIAARAGDAVMFDNVLTDGRPDLQSQHAGLPVTAGAKWLATRWIRATPYDPWNPS